VTAPKARGSGLAKQRAERATHHESQKQPFRSFQAEKIPRGGGEMTRKQLEIVLLPTLSERALSRVLRTLRSSPIHRECSREVRLSMTDLFLWWGRCAHSAPRSLVAAAVTRFRNCRGRPPRSPPARGGIAIAVAWQWKASRNECSADIVAAVCSCRRPAMGFSLCRRPIPHAFARSRTALPRAGLAYRPLASPADNFYHDSAYRPAHWARCPPWVILSPPSA
jgi:hypothetical protein